MPAKKLPTTLTGLLTRVGDYTGAGHSTHARELKAEYEQCATKIAELQKLMERTNTLRARHLASLLARVLPEQQVSFGAKSPVITIGSACDVQLVSCVYVESRQGRATLEFNAARPGPRLTLDFIVDHVGDVHELLNLVQRVVEKKLSEELVKTLS
jgi:hypothetical protein